MTSVNPPSDRGCLRARVWLAYLVFFAIGVPWYWPGDDERLVLGFPLWAFVSFLSCVAIASLTAWLFLFRWPEADDGDVADEEKGAAER